LPASHQPEQSPRVILIGASSGGTEALDEVVAGLPSELRAAVFIVRHVPGDSVNYLPQLLQGRSGLPVRLAADHDRIEAGTIYIAPSDRHLLIDADQMYLGRGPRENRARPAVDPLFRSGALAHGPRAIGVVLSGLLDDGSAGLIAIKRSGGIAIVQDPDDALCPDMPHNALRHVEADHCLPAAEIGPALAELVSADPPQHALLPELPELQEGWRREVAIQLQGSGAVGTAVELGEQVPASCPECGGPLWKMQDGVLRFRCHTGHALTALHLAEGFEHAAETALWAALRVLDERARMLRRMAERDGERGYLRSQAMFAERAQDAERHVDTLRKVLNLFPSNDPAG